MGVQIGIVRAALQTEEQRVEAAHQTHSELCRTEFDAAVAEFERRISEAQPSGTHTGAHAPSATPQNGAASTQLATMQQQIAEMQIALQATQAQAAAQAAASQQVISRLQRENASAHCEKASLERVDGAPSVADLPTLDVKASGLMTECSAAYDLVTRWQAIGGPPLTVGEAAIVCPAFPVVLKNVFASHLTHWFTADPPADAIVTKQLACLLLGALLALKSRHESLAQVDEGATKRHAEWAEELCKRVRG